MIADWMTGAEITWLSRMIANRLPMFACVTSAKRAPPAVFIVKSTMGRLSCGSNACFASVSCSPVISVSRLSAMRPVAAPGALFST